MKSTQTNLKFTFLLGQGKAHIYKGTGRTENQPNVWAAIDWYDSCLKGDCTQLPWHTYNN